VEATLHEADQAMLRAKARYYKEPSWNSAAAKAGRHAALLKSTHAPNDF
jgi:hypothetical protein